GVAPGDSHVVDAIRIWTRVKVAPACSHGRGIPSRAHAGVQQSRTIFDIFYIFILLIHYSNVRNRRLSQSIHSASISPLIFFINTPWFSIASILEKFAGEVAAFDRVPRPRGARHDQRRGPSPPPGVCRREGVQLARPGRPQRDRGDRDGRT
ncbi:unnamed protein product, partial [Nesidiocoris tenuis]